jgi:predicted nucleic acid-binding protein
MRFQAWLHRQNPAKGFPQTHADQALADLQSDLDSGAVVLTAAEWPDVLSRAELLSRRHTRTGGHRGLDILHIATALHLEATELLTFDKKQRRLARAASLKVRP